MVTVGLISDDSENSAAFLETPRTSASYSGGSCEQSADGYASECSPEEASDREYGLLQHTLPEGFTATLSLTGKDKATFGDKSVIIYFTQNDSEMAPPPGEILVPQRVWSDLNASIGDVLTMGNGAEIRIAGTTPSGTSLAGEPTFADPATYSSPKDDSPHEYWGSWKITGPTTFTWDDVLRLNAVGFVVS